MRVLFLNDPPLIKYGLALGWQQAGEEAMILPMWRIPAEQQRDVLFETVEHWKPHVVFLEGLPAGVRMSNVASLLETLGHTTRFFYWAIEDPVQTDVSMPWAALASHVFTTTAESLPRYQAMGKNCSLLTFAANPAVHYQAPIRQDLETDVLLVASNYDRRASYMYEQLLWPLIEQWKKGKFRMKIYGAWWDDQTRAPYHLADYPELLGGRMAYEELAFAHASAKIVLGAEQERGSSTQSSMRVYEALGCRAFYLSPWTQQLQANWVNGNQLVWTQSAEETVALVDKYLKDDVARGNIATWGQEFVYANHLYAQHRVPIILAAYEILRGGSQ